MAVVVDVVNEPTAAQGSTAAYASQLTAVHKSFVMAPGIKGAILAIVITPAANPATVLAAIEAVAGVQSVANAIYHVAKNPAADGCQTICYQDVHFRHDPIPA
jgi:hypothetical protein